MIITLAFPSKGVCDPAFAVALRDLELPEGCGYAVVYSAGADTAVSRNLLAEKARDVGDYIFFVDDWTICENKFKCKFLGTNGYIPIFTRKKCFVITFEYIKKFF